MPESKTSPRQQKFIEEYLVDFNATQAAIRAGYKETTAYSQGQRLLKKVEIQTAIQELRDRDSATAGITRERVLREYARLAFGDMRSLGQWNTAILTLRKSTELTDEEAAMIAEVSNTIDGGTKIKLYDKLRALEGIRKMLGFDAPTKHEVTGEDGGPIPVVTMLDMLLLAHSDSARFQEIIGRLAIGGKDESGRDGDADGG